MEVFVKSFVKNPDTWRSRLSPEQRVKIAKSVENILGTTPRTDKIVLEAKIIFRRFPEELGEVTRKAVETVTEFVWPDKQFLNRRSFWIWFWTYNHNTCVTTLMVANYDMQDAMTVVRKKMRKLHKRLKLRSELYKNEAKIIWGNFVRTENRRKYKRFKTKLTELYEEHRDRLEMVGESASLESDTSEDLDSVGEEIYSDEVSDSEELFPIRKKAIKKRIPVDNSSESSE